VLLGTGDDRFMRLASFLLTRNQFEVQTTKRVMRTADLVERHKADVVVIDASESLGDAARAVAAIEALHPHVGVVVVCDGEPPRWTTGLKVTEKWEALETLPQDIRLLAEDARAWS
jgi:DNA-binding NtrC family response regulator